MGFDAALGKLIVAATLITWAVALWRNGGGRK